MTKILLVEDDKSLREIYGVRLLAEGYDIISAGDGEEALAMAIKDRPSLIVSDVMMPKISGFDMLDILRSTTETRDIKVIMMTALSSEDQRQRGESLGADRYLVKSQVGIEDVVRTVHEVLGDGPAGMAQPSPAAAPAPQAAPTQPTPTPAVTVPPRQPSPAPVAAPQPTPVAAPATQPAPTTPVAPVQPTASSNTEEASFPQPTAPFSTPRPANLGDRVIQPLAKEDTEPSEADLAKRMEQELSAAVQSVTPSPEPAAETTVPAASQPTAPPPPIPPAPQQPQQSNSAPQEPSSLSFEETPRQEQSSSAPLPPAL